MTPQNPTEPAPGGAEASALRLVPPPAQRDGALALNDYVVTHHLPIPSRIALFEQLLGAIGATHSQARLHGDWTFSRILVSPEGQLRLDEQAQKSRMVGLMGAEFASPEQLRGGRITTASDMYSAGVLFYWLLCGQHPHAQALGDLAALAESVLRNDPEPPSARLERLMNSVSKIDYDDLAAFAQSTEEDPDRIAQQIEGELEAIALKLLRRDPKERYQSAGEVTADLRRMREDRTVSALPDTRAYRLNKWILRYPVLASFVLVSSLGLLLGLLGTFWQVWEAKRERDQGLARVADSRKLIQTVVGPLTEALEALPRSVEVRQTITARAVERLDRLVRLNPGDSRARLDYAEASLKLANALGSPAAGGNRDVAKASENFDRAFRLANVQASDIKRDKEALELLARIDCAKGDFHLELGDVPRARQDGQQGAALFERLIHDHISDKALLEHASGCYAALARSWTSADQIHAEAGAALRRAYELDGFLTRLAPREVRHRQSLALSTIRLADWMDRSGNKGAARLYEEGLRSLDTTGSPLDPALSNLKAQLLHKLGQNDRDAGNWDLAVQRFGAAAQTRESLAGAQAGDRTNTIALAASFSGIAEIEEQRERWPNALKYWQRVADVLKPLSVGGGASAAYGEALCRAAVIQARMDHKDDAQRTALMGVEQLRVSARLMDGKPEELRRAASSLLEDKPEELWQPWLAWRYVTRAAELTAFQDPEILRVLCEAQGGVRLGKAAIKTASRALTLLPESPKGRQAQLRAVLERYSVSPPRPKIKPKETEGEEEPMDETAVAEPPASS